MRLLALWFLNLIRKRLQCARDINFPKNYLRTIKYYTHTRTNKCIQTRTAHSKSFIFKSCYHNFQIGYTFFIIYSIHVIAAATTYGDVAATASFVLLFFFSPSQLVYPLLLSNCFSHTITPTHSIDAKKKNENETKIFFCAQKSSPT